MDKELEQANKNDVSHYLDKDYRQVSNRVMAIENQMKTLSASVDTLSNKLDGSTEVSKANTTILHNVQESQTNLTSRMGEVLDSLQGRTILGQKEPGALSKVDEMYEWYKIRKDDVVLIPDQQKKTALELLIDYFWAIRILAPLIGLGSLAAIIQFFVWLIPTLQHLVK